MTNDTTSPLPSGVRLQERYLIQERLAAGGFGVVYRGVDERMNRPVAIKVLALPQLGTPQERTLVERFHREAMATGQLTHPCTVRCFDFGETTDGDLFIVMEFLQGHNLHDELQRNGPMQPHRAVSLTIGCLEALGEAHQRGIVHKDLKPANLFLTQPGSRFESLKIVDFGVAAFVHGQRRLTRKAEVFGTPQYFAPEYLKSRDVAPSVDVYQMGIILVEMLIGERLLPEDTFECLQRHKRGDLRIPPWILDSSVGPIIARSTQRLPQDRYPNGLTFADALGAIGELELQAPSVSRLPQRRSSTLPLDLDPTQDREPVSDTIRQPMPFEAPLPDTIPSIPPRPSPPAAGVAPATEEGTSASSPAPRHHILLLVIAVVAALFLVILLLAIAIIATR